MTNLIQQRVELARAGQNPFVICQLPSGWLVIGDVQPLDGYCLLLADPVAESLNALDEKRRARYLRDMGRIGDAILAVTDAFRINYETWGNSEPSLHTHIVPRYLREPEEKRRRPACMGYDWAAARPFDSVTDAHFVELIRSRLE
jgi:diadenosine tetraphosphate (Ap4A) HIT family hydrolase